MSYRIDWLAIAPELIVVAGILGVLTLDLFLTRADKYWTGVVAVLTVTAAAVPLIVMAADDSVRAMFDGSPSFSRASSSSPDTSCC